MIFGWLGAKGLFGLAKGLWVAIAVALVILAVVWLRADENADDKANQDLGVAKERSETQAETILTVEKANEAREEINRLGPVGDVTRYNQCLRTARTSANCARWLPHLQAPVGGTEPRPLNP